MEGSCRLGRDQARPLSVAQERLQARRRTKKRARQSNIHRQRPVSSASIRPISAPWHLLARLLLWGHFRPRQRALPGGPLPLRPKKLTSSPNENLVAMGAGVGADSSFQNCLASSVALFLPAAIISSARPSHVCSSVSVTTSLTPMNRSQNSTYPLRYWNPGCGTVSNPAS